jgi:hypothetical protein
LIDYKHKDTAISVIWGNYHDIFLTRESNGNHHANENGETPTCLNPRGKKACNGLITALLQSIMKIRSQGAMENHR